MNPDLDTLVTALYVTVDDLLVAHPQWAPPRPAVGFAPELSDAELVSLAVLGALLGFDSEARFVRYAKAHLTPWFPYVPERPGYNKRLRRSGELMAHVMAALARDCPSYHDDVWVVDSTPVECGRSRETQKRSDLARMGHLRVQRQPLPVLLGTAPAPARRAVGAADRFRARWRESRRTRRLFGHDRSRRRGPAGSDPHRRQGLPQRRLRSPTQRRGHRTHPPRHQNRIPTPERAGEFLRPLRQIIESINQTLKAQLGLERHGGRTRPGVAARVLQRLLALTAAIWHNQTTHQPGPARSLIAYDH